MVDGVGVSAPTPDERLVKAAETAVVEYQLSVRLQSSRLIEAMAELRAALAESRPPGVAPKETR